MSYISRSQRRRQQSFPSLWRFTKSLLIILTTGAVILGLFYLNLQTRAGVIAKAEQDMYFHEQQVNQLHEELDRLKEANRILRESVGDTVERKEELRTELREVRGRNAELVDSLQGYSKTVGGLSKDTQEMLERLDLLVEAVEQIADEIEYEIEAPKVPELEEIMGVTTEEFDEIVQVEHTLEVANHVIPQVYDVLDDIDDYLTEKDTIPSGRPCNGRITSGFGWRAIPYARSGTQFHTGVDISGDCNAHIIATASGRVTTRGWVGSYGNLIIINHGNGYETYYAHLAGFNVSHGQEVATGDVIGFMGRTGRTTGVHLHYEIRYWGEPVNPVNYF